MRNITLRVDYIHAERLSEAKPEHVDVQVQLSIPSREPKWEARSVEIPYTATVNTSPPIFSITVKGRALIEGPEEEIAKLREEFSRKKVAMGIVQAVTSFVLFEVALLARELGFPPTIPSISLPKRERPPPGMAPV